MRKCIVWFRNDLRIHDNEALTEALHAADEVLPVFVFDDQFYKSNTRHYSFPKTGKYRLKFVLESVLNLKNNLKRIGLDLLIKTGKSDQILYDLALEYKTSWIYCNRERTSEEVLIQDALEKKLWTIGQEIRYSRGKMLFHTADLPFPITHTPDVFTNFRKEVERFIPIREPLPVPSTEGKSLVAIEQDLFDFFPDWEYFGLPNPDDFSLRFAGGEDAGIKQLNYYLFDSDLIAKYKKTRNGLIGNDYSSKFSMYLSLGCLSPKFIYQKIKKYEQERTKNESTYWLVFELFWRDFFRLMGKKHHNKIFQFEGTLGRQIENLDQDMTKFNKWATGQTGVPFVDANMNELNQTGFMSNRGRQNVASYLIKDMGMNWMMGAEYFESLLLDYDPCSNYGNWNYIAGVGSDPRIDRKFQMVMQAKKYDPQGDFVHQWIPALKHVERKFIFEPHLMTEEEQIKNKLIIGQDYPSPIHL